MRGGLTGSGQLSLGGALASFGERTAVLVTSAVVAAVLLAAAVVALPPMVASATAPRTLEQTHLTGARTPNCVRIVVLPDMSGSMSGVAPVREAAFQRFMRWAPANLRTDDELAVIPWDNQAVVALAPTPVEELDASAPVPETTGGSGGTDVVAALKTVAGLPETGCATHLAFISDGVIGATTSMRSLLAAAHVDSVAIVLPSASTPPSDWSAVFPAEQVERADPGDQQQTALAVSRIVAVATGQQLARR